MAFQRLKDAAEKAKCELSGALQTEMNLPFIISTGKNDALRQIAEYRYFAWPRSQDNAVLRLARLRLLGGSRAGSLRTAAMQQGVLQIVRDFCEHSNALCEHCRFPELVRSLAAARAPSAC